MGSTELSIKSKKSQVKPDIELLRQCSPISPYQFISKLAFFNRTAPFTSSPANSASFSLLIFKRAFLAGATL